MAEEMDIDDGLYNRQRYVLGDSAMKKMSQANVLISGLSGLGVEIAKNVVLAGVKSVTLNDHRSATFLDLSTQDQLGKNRALACLERMASLNPYVKLQTSAVDLAEADLSFLDSFTCVVLCEAALNERLRVDHYCHQRDISFISSSVFGVFAQAFVDLGKQFEVYDKDGEECKEVMIQNISQAKEAVVTCLPFHIHGLETGDVVKFREVSGMTALNEGEYEVKVMNPSTFSVKADTTSMPKHEGGGVATQVKVVQRHSFKPLSSAIGEPDILIADFAKMEAPAQMHLAFAALDQFLEEKVLSLSPPSAISSSFMTSSPQSPSQSVAPKPWFKGDADRLLSLAKAINSKWPAAAQVASVDERLVRQLAFTARGCFQPLAAFMGGVIGQEVLKALTGKFTPLKQWMYMDLCEVLPDLASSSEDFQPKDEFLDAQAICLGWQLVKLLGNLRVFMVGAGAIGCELLKNMAMMGVGGGENGLVIVTDPDLIEKSNLNRQFLFRPPDINKPKSVCAALAATAMNPTLHIKAELDKVGPATEEKYDNAFMDSLDLVVNALDNVAARLYMDTRCVAAIKPLMESGTLGAKGHVQVIVPHLTESYASTRDPPEKDVPFCTLHSFPNHIDHCIQWARDKFQKIFVVKPEEVAKCVTASDPVQKMREGGAGQTQSLRTVVKLLRNCPHTFEECVRLARFRFQSYFHNNILHLLNKFPLDMKTQEGSA